MDVFIISPNGGRPKRLTTNSATETLQGWLDNTHVLYTSNLQPSVSDISFPGSFQQVYSVDTEANRPVMPTPANTAHQYGLPMATATTTLQKKTAPLISTRQI